MNTKSNLLKSIFISLILLVGGTNAWAASEGSSWYDWASSENVYFDNTNSSYTNVSMLIGRQWTYGGDGIGSSGVNFTKVANTNNLYHAATTWNKYNTLLFMDATGWGWEGNKVTQRYTYANNYTNTNNVNINGTELFYAASSTKGADLKHEDLSGYEALNSQQTIQSVVDGADANSKATISITSYKMTAHKTTTEQTATLGTGANVSYITAARTAITELTVGDVATGYQFDGWYTAATGGTQLSKEKTYTYYPTAATTVYARFSTIKYTVTYGVHSSGNGTLAAKVGSNSITSGNKVNYDSEVVFTAKPDDGYQIEGWYSNSACTTPIDNGTNNTYTVTITTGTNVYVKFEAIPANSHNITYTEEGTGWTYGTKPTSAEEGASVTFVVTPTAGYRVSVTSTDVTLNTNGNNYTFTMPNKDVEITIDAKPEQYTVTLDDQGATTAGTTSVTATYNAALSSITPPAKTGYTFGGYYTATNGGGTQYYKADGTSAKTWTETSVTELYAKWTANTYSITYKDQGDVAFSGTHASGYPTTHTYGTATTLKTASKTDYTFDGWFTTSDCSGTAVTSLGATTYTSDITLYAKWTEIPPTTVYLQPNANWKKDNARFAIYCWNSSGNEWFDMTKMDCDGGNYYMVEIPVAYKEFKFVRLNPATTENNWDSGTKWNETGNLKVPTDDKVLFSISGWDSGSWGTYSAPQYAITITNGTGGTVTVKQGANTITSGNKVNLNAVITATLAANDGYSKGTAKIKIGDNAEANLVEGQEYTICGPTTITAEFESNIRTVSFDANGHGTEPEEQTINSGEKATEPAPLTEEGYTFGGWYTEKECTTQFDFNTEITVNITLYAQWTANTYTVTLDDQWGEGGTTSVTATYGAAMPKATMPIRTGYTFNGYFTEISGGTKYYNADGSSAKNWDKTSETTLYAQWTPITYYVQFDANGGEGSMEEQEFTYNVPQNLTANTFTKTGYNFLRWNTKSDGSGTGYANQNNIKNLTSTDKETITLYAQWNAIRYKITYTSPTNGTYCLKVGEGGDWSGDTDAIYEQQITLKVQSEAAGYHFEGWTVTKTGGETVTVTDNKFTMPAEDITIAATFAPNISTITWDANGGTVDPTTSTYTYDGEDIELPTPTRTGYTFNGWFTAASDGTKITEIGTTNKPTSDVTYYALWTANTYTVTLNQTDATTQGTTSVTATYDADMPSATMPTKTGYVFGGYYDQENGQGTQYYNADGTSARTWDKIDNTTLYAHFVTPQIEVTLNASTFKPGTASVTATATVTPAPADGTTSICWSLLYSGSENKVAGHEPTPTYGNSVQFSIGDLAAGSYTIKAILREGTGCEGTEISSATQTFLITSSHTITIKYTCDGKEIQASTTQEAQVSSETTITAPDIFGYTFSNWEAGDGVTIKETNGTEVTFTAIYDGYLTAKYNVNNNIVYFKNTLGWEKVYVYTFSDNAWVSNESDQPGVHPRNHTREQGEMIRIGETDIYYFALSNPNSNYTQDNNANNNYIAFSNNDMKDWYAFHNAKAVYRGDHKNNLTLFIPQVDQTPEVHNSTQYYSTGIWMKYNSTESGYQIPSNLPNGDWNTYTDNFTTTNPGGYTFSITKNLAANTEYEFKIRNYVWIHNDWEDNGNGKDNNQWFGYDGTITQSVSGLLFHDQNAEKTGYNNTKIKTTTAGEYTFTIDLSQGKVLLSVEYPIAVGDYRVIYKDNATWSQGTTAHNANWYHPSRIIKKNKTNKPTKDIISFFISHGNNPTMKFQKVERITNGNVTWVEAGDASIPNNITTPGVYNFVIIQEENGKSISMENNAEPYTGNYYIRCDAVGGKWDNYKTDKENRMTYSAFSEKRETNSFGELFSHYVTKYCPHGTNIKFTVANDYSPCISDTLVLDYGGANNNTTNPFGNLEEDGTLKTDGSNNDKYSANVRFMWNRKTNKISRAYIGRAVTNDFLVITGDKQLQKSDGKTLRDTIVFFDTQNWIYEVKMKVQPTTRVKVYAAYPAGVGKSKAQYFCGAHNNDAFNDDEDSKLALGGSANDKDYYSIRVLYDFKTNRLLMAWMPSGDTENVDGPKTISADVMLIRDHQNPAQCITFADENSKLSEVKTVYGTMRFNRWVLNNRGGQDNLDANSCGGADSYDESKTTHNHPLLPQAERKSQYERALYFISFPFNVNVSDIFGFGTYGQHWIIEYYDGLKRAREGYWIDSDPNWKYVTNPDEFVLEKYKGYILCLNLGKMAYNNTDFWAHNISQVELYFPSTTTMSEIKRTEVTMPELGDEYLCTINRNTPEGDRRVKDSYWRCIGVPSYANYSNVLTNGEQQTIQWQTSYEQFPFLYAWNMTDNTLTPQSTTNFNFKTMHAYLVQNGGEIHWSAVSATPNQPAGIIAKEREEVMRNYEWKLTLSRNEQIEDQAFVRLSDDEQITTEFDFNQDLSKEFNYGRSDIYTLIGYEKAAANSLPLSEQTTLIPLGLSIEYNGDYTIAMPDGTANIGVTLIDTESNTRTNLSAGMEYTLTLNKGDYNNRFFIEISPIQQTPTDIEYVTGDSNSQNSVRKVLIDNILYIVRDGQMFDARGARVK